MRILLAADEISTVKAIERPLRSVSFNVYTTDMGEEAVDLAKLYDYDAILLAIKLSDMSGLEVLRQLRAAKIQTPVLFFSEGATAEDRAQGLNFGADDYMGLPVHCGELVARIHAIVRRAKGFSESFISVGDLAFNLNTKMLSYQGKPVHLSGKLAQMMELFFLRKGAALTKDMFLNHIYGGLDEPDSKIIDVMVCKLRAVIAQATEGRNYIETVWGRGYVLRDDALAPLSYLRTPRIPSPSIQPAA